jgi:hypothetical protein
VKKSKSLLSISDVELSQMIVEYLMNNPDYKLKIDGIASHARCWPKRIREIINGKNSFTNHHLSNLANKNLPPYVYLLMCKHILNKIVAEPGKNKLRL